MAIELGLLRQLTARLADHALVNVKVNAGEGEYKITLTLGENEGYIDVGGPLADGGDYDTNGITATGAD